MAWNLPGRGGIGGFADGPERVMQVKATQMDDPGLWTDKWRDQRTDMAKDYNQLLKDRNRYGEGYIDQAGIGLNTREKFFDEYPNIPRTFEPFEDLEEQMNIGQFPKKAPPGYFDKYDLAGGGIASLENRPGYGWGAFVGKYPLSREGKANLVVNRFSDALGPSRSDLTTGKFSGGVDRPSWGDYANTYSKYGRDFDTGMRGKVSDTLRSLVNAGPLTNIFGNLTKSQRANDLADDLSDWMDKKDYKRNMVPFNMADWMDKKDYKRNMVPFNMADMTMADRTYNEPDEYGRMRPTIPNPYAGARLGGGWDETHIYPNKNYERDTGYGGWLKSALQGVRAASPLFNEGGAVGLEPGIGSLMGYAKGGMVTKMKVKKGQSKWLKKFMNNMRDN